jgi:glyoxylase I family protein
MESLAELTAHLLELECSLHDRDVRADATRLGELLADDFHELGVSGSIWNKQGIIAALSNEQFSSRKISDFSVKLLAPDVALVTYRGYRFASEYRPAAESLRSSIWRCSRGKWQMVFHQGTAL